MKVAGDLLHRCDVAAVRRAAGDAAPERRELLAECGVRRVDLLLYTCTGSSPPHAWMTRALAKAMMMAALRITYSFLPGASRAP
jgi:hypothetical protein